MDEIDGCAGNEDRGGVGALNDIIKTTKIPIIFICNDKWNAKLKTLSNNCYDLPFSKPDKRFITNRLVQICNKEGLKVAIVGLPNVGKSSILNSLVKDARAIVTDIPGTTRDILEDQIEIRGLLVRLFDTAGITSTEDKIEKEGIKRSLKAIKNADLLLFVIENNNDIEKFMSHLKPEVKGQFKNKQIILIKNKIDLYKKKTSIKDIFGMKIIKICECSAKTGKGIREIENTIFNEIQKNEADESILITNVRHQKLLDKSLKNLKKAKELARAQEPEDKILIEFDEANKALGEIIGEITTDDILDKIFSMFCIGK